MDPLEFLTTAAVFSMLGYALCYLTLSTSRQDNQNSQEGFDTPELSK